MNDEKLQNIATQVRRDIIRMTNMAKSGHPGGSLGCTDFLTLMYFEIMDIDPDHFTLEGPNEDIFILSNGHISPAFYSILARRGFFPIEELATFRRINSRLQGHPTPSDHLPGVRLDR
ncbi:MAG: transketolase, partial [Bacteroidales bacterium]|nr:transketolase [Bacteroidales bacterium]